MSSSFHHFHQHIGMFIHFSRFFFLIIITTAIIFLLVFFFLIYPVHLFFSVQFSFFILHFAFHFFLFSPFSIFLCFLVYSRFHPPSLFLFSFFFLFLLLSLSIGHFNHHISQLPGNHVMISLCCFLRFVSRCFRLFFLFSFYYYFNN